MSHIEIKNDVNPSGKKYVLMTIVSSERYLRPDNLMYGFKFLSFVDTQKDANNLVKKLKKQYKNYDVIVCENGCTFNFDVQNCNIKDEHYENTASNDGNNVELNNIMERTKENKTKIVKYINADDEEIKDYSDEDFENLYFEENSKYIDNKYTGKKSVNHDVSSDENSGYVLMSMLNDKFISGWTEGDSFKIRGNFDNLVETQRHFNELSQKDKLNLVGLQVGKWYVYGSNTYNKQVSLLKSQNPNDIKEGQNLSNKDIQSMEELINRYEYDMSRREHWMKKRKERVKKQAATEEVERLEKEKIDGPKVLEQKEYKSSVSQEDVMKRLNGLIGEEETENLIKMTKREKHIEKIKMERGLIEKVEHSKKEDEDKPAISNYGKKISSMNDNNRLLKLQVQLEKRRLKNLTKESKKEEETKDQK